MAIGIQNIRPANRLFGKTLLKKISVILFILVVIIIKVIVFDFLLIMKEDAFVSSEDACSGQSPTGHALCSVRNYYQHQICLINTLDPEVKCQDIGSPLPDHDWHVEVVRSRPEGYYINHMPSETKLAKYINSMKNVDGVWRVIGKLNWSLDHPEDRLVRSINQKR